MSKKSVEADHFCKYKYPCSLKKNDKNDMVAYSVIAVDKDSNAYTSHIQIIKQGNITEIPDTTDVDDFCWIDSEILCIKQTINDEDKEKIERGIPLSVFYYLNVETLEKKEAFRVEKNATLIKSLGDNKAILLCEDNLYNEKILEECKGDLSKYITRCEEESNYFIVEEVPFWADGKGNTNRIRNRLYLFDNGKLHQITSEYFDVYKAKENGTYVAFYGLEFSDVRLTNSSLYILDLKTMNVIKVNEDTEYIYIDILPVDEENIIAIRSDRKLYGEYQNEYIDKINYISGGYERINGDCEIHLYNSVLTDIAYGTSCQSFAPCENGIFLIATLNDKTNICFGNFETGEISTLLKENHALAICEFVLLNNAIMMIALEGLGGPEIFELKLGNRAIEKITSYNVEINNEFELLKVNTFTFKSKDQTVISGYYIKPINYREGEKIKTILSIHGGPNTAYGTCYFHEMQFLASRGYGIIFCNPRGSIGRGGKFADIRNRYYKDDYDDIMALADYAVEHFKWVDRNCMAVIGGSYGGMMTNWIIGHTDRFKTAISDRSVANELSDFFTSDIGLSFGLDTHEKTPWDKGGIELYWHDAAISYARNINTPTLFVHGEDDFRCTKEQSLQMFAALKYNQVPSKVFIVKGEGHGLCWWGKPKARIRRLEEMVSWLNEYL